MNAQNNAENGFELQPQIHVPATHPSPVAPPAAQPATLDEPQPLAPEDILPTDWPSAEAHVHPAETPPAHAIPDGPPPEEKEEKVDFENLPEFVWQREMLRTVRLIAVFVTLVIGIVLLVAFLGLGKGTKDSLKDVIENQPKPTDSTK